MLARFLLWRLLGVLATVLTILLSTRLLDGGLGAALTGKSSSSSGLARAAGSLKSRASEHTSSLHVTLAAIEGAASSVLWVLGGLTPLFLLSAAVMILIRARARRRRHYVRLQVDPYRGDSADADAVIAMFEALHKRLLNRWWRRLSLGQPTVALEVHHGEQAWLAVSCPAGLEGMVQAALRTAYPNCALTPVDGVLGTPPAVLRLKKHASFIKRVKVLDRFAHQRELPVNRLITAMGACGEPAFVQIAMTPTPAFFERYAKLLYKHHEARLSRERREHLFVRDRSMVEEMELRGGISLQHKPLFFVDIRVIAPDRRACERIASELRAEEAENRLVERGTSLRHGLLGLYSARVLRGEGNPLPSPRRGVFASTELAALWHLPSVGYSTVPFVRSSVPLAPASPCIMRPAQGAGVLRDALGPVSIHPQMRKQNTAVPGTVEQGKSSFLVATIAEDLRRERCAVILLDPKGDAADAAVSLVASNRTCTLLDFSHPTCGFNPLAVDAPADVIANYVVGALKNLFTDADIRASSDRYLRNAVIAVLAYDRRSTLWDAARLLSVGEEGYSYRARVGARVRALPEFKEISEFFTAELSAQLADARSTTTSKLDAPVNKLARLLNSASIKRVLLNESLTVDFDRVISGAEVLVVKGAMGAMGAGNTSVLMQLLVGMLDAALARQQDLVTAEERVAVALKVDEAPLVLNRGFAETMALKRSAGLETVACWQTDAQWTDRDLREQLDALFAHRVMFATASVKDARASASLMMAKFSDVVRPDVEGLSALGHPDARLRLPKHHAIVSWSTPEGRQPPFIAQTIPMRVDRERLALHAELQRARGGRHRSDLSQPHWDRQGRSTTAESSDRSSASSIKVSPEEDVAMPAAQESTPAASYSELVELDRASGVRWAKPVASPKVFVPQPLDLEILTLIASLGHLLSSQIHQRFNAQRAATTTQRRLKRLSEAGLVERFQFYRRDGGSVPMCYVIAPGGVRLLAEHGRLSDAGISTEESQVRESPSGHGPPGTRTSGANDDRLLRSARSGVHAAAWGLALERALDTGRLTLRGAAASVISPPLHSTQQGRVAYAPADLRLPGGRTPHEFLRSDPSGARVEVERFETVRPALTAELPPGVGDRERQDGHEQGNGEGDRQAIDLIVELDDRLAKADDWRAVAKLERYDHFISGWSVHAKRYGQRQARRPLVVFLCRDQPRARACARRADAVLTACRAYAGEYPADWEYPGRERILFAAERDTHEGLLRAYGVPRLPPEVRASASADPAASQPLVELREIVGYERSTEART